MVENDPLTEKIIGAAFEVQSRLGPYLLETAYEDTLEIEFSLCGLASERQVTLPFDYKSHIIRRGYRCDMIVQKQVIIEIKTVEKLIKAHEAQVLTYLKLSGLPVGLLINFNSVPLRNGIRRLTNPDLYPPKPPSRERGKYW
jgi:GxxExxY protein